MPLQTVLNPKWKPKIDALAGRFGLLKEGESLTYHEVSAIIGITPEVKAWNYVLTQAAQKVKAETGVRLIRVHGLGVRCPTGKEQLDAGINGMGNAARKMAREVVDIANVSDARLPDEADRKRRDHAMNFFKRLGDTVMLEKRSLLQLPTTPTAHA